MIISNLFSINQNLTFFMSKIIQLLNRAKYFLAIAIFLYLIYYWSFGKAGLVYQYRLNKNNENLMQSVQSLKDSIVVLEQSNNNLLLDSHYVKKIIREKLGMGYTNERIFKVLNSKIKIK